MWVGVYFHGNTVLFSAHFGMLVKNLLIMNLVFYSVPSGLVIIISQNSSKSMDPLPSSSSSSRMPSSSSSVRGGQQFGDEPAQGVCRNEPLALLVIKPEGV